MAPIFGSLGTPPSLRAGALRVPPGPSLELLEAEELVSRAALFHLATALGETLVARTPETAPTGGREGGIGDGKVRGGW